MGFGTSGFGTSGFGAGAALSSLVSVDPITVVYDNAGNLIGTADPNYTGDHSCLAHIYDHAENAQTLLISQYQEKPRIAALLKAFVDKVQELEDTTFAMDDARRIDAAEGWWIDAIGNVVGQPRYGTADADYRKLIRARIAANRSNGTGSDINDVVRALYTISEMTFQVTEPPSYEAEMHVNLDNNSFVAFTPEIVFRFLMSAKAAAVRLLMFFQLVPTSNCFAFSATPGVSTVDANKGFSNVALATGGRLRGVKGSS